MNLLNRAFLVALGVHETVSTQVLLEIAENQVPLNNKVNKRIV